MTPPTPPRSVPPFRPAPTPPCTVMSRAVERHEILHIDTDKDRGDVRATQNPPSQFFSREKKEGGGRKNGQFGSGGGCFYQIAVFTQDIRMSDAKKRREKIWISLPLTAHGDEAGPGSRLLGRRPNVLQKKANCSTILLVICHLARDPRSQI